LVDKLCTTIIKLAENADSQEALGAAGVCDRLVTLVKDQPLMTSSAALAEKVCGAVKKLSDGNGFNQLNFWGCSCWRSSGRSLARGRCEFTGLHDSSSGWQTEYAALFAT